MNLPEWARQGDFWQRHYELAELVEDAAGEACEDARQAEVDALIERMERER